MTFALLCLQPPESGIRLTSKQALGVSGLSKSSASRMLAELDEGMRAFCQRRLPPCPYVFVDARFGQVRDHGRVVSKAVLIDIGVTTE